MALDKLQNLPTDKPQSGMAVLTQTITVLAIITVSACWIATQYAAWKLGFQTALGSPLVDLHFHSWKVYQPFGFFFWLWRFGAITGTEPAWHGGEMILASLHFLFVPTIWMAMRRAKKISNKTDLHGSAKWATRDDIYNAGLLRRPSSIVEQVAQAIHLRAQPQKGAKGCYVGAWKDPDTGAYQYLTHDGPEHILAFAPTRSGKGVGLVLPTLLSWRASTVVHDIKGEAWALTAGWRKAIGQKVLKFAPGSEATDSVRFNPLEEIRIGTLKEVGDAQNVAQMIVDPDGKGMQDHWAKTGHELLSAAIIHILYAREIKSKTLRSLVSFFCDPSRTIVQVAESMLHTEHDIEGQYDWEDPISGAPTKTHPMVAEAARSFLNKATNEQSGVQSTAMSFLSLYRDPIVANNTSGSEFKVRDLMNSEDPVSLYIVVPPNDMARLRPLVRLVFNLIFRLNTEKMEFEGGRSIASYKHRMLMMLDEFPALGKLDIVEESLAFVAGYGLKCYLITQDLTQLYKAYTKDESIISNCHIRIAYAPNKVETAELLSKYCGTTTISRAQRNYSGSRLNPFLMHVMASDQETQRSLLTADECLRLPAAIKSADGKEIKEPGDMLILPAGSNPIYGQQILYFKDPMFNGRSKIPAPKESDKLREAPIASPRRSVSTTPLALAGLPTWMDTSAAEDAREAAPTGARAAYEQASVTVDQIEPERAHIVAETPAQIPSKDCTETRGILPPGIPDAAKVSQVLREMKTAEVAANVEEISEPSASDSNGDSEEVPSVEANDTDPLDFPI